MKLGLINSAWVQADRPTVFGLQKTKELGFDTVDIFIDPLDIDVRERRLIKDECDRLDLPIVSLACVANACACSWSSSARSRSPSENATSPRRASSVGVTSPVSARRG